MSSAPDSKYVPSLKDILLERLLKLGILTTFPEPSSIARDARTLTPAFFKLQKKKYENILDKGGVHENDIPSLEDRFSELDIDCDMRTTKDLLRGLDEALNTAYHALGGDAANPHSKTNWRGQLLRWDDKGLCDEIHVLFIIESLEKMFVELDTSWKNREVLKRQGE